MHHEILQVQPAAIQRKHRDCNQLQNRQGTNSSHHPFASADSWNRDSKSQAATYNKSWGTSTGQSQQSAAARVAWKFLHGLSREDITPLDRLQVVQEVNRKWAKVLDLFEFRVVSYILDRTVLWGRKTFRACHENILNGTDRFAGIGLKRAKYLSTLKSLEDRKVITRERTRNFVVLGLNLDWEPEEVLMKLPTSKNASEPGKDQKSTTRTSRSPRHGHRIKRI
ncbi:hypothetical protein [Leisingera sp. ANG-M6]|uniref:hypothetical protein n=1 Tax=Leisingera sp. ANG-M6 TaxID=1577900 RepID=UPI00126A2146|nr:hypothetical protein [Leisingera sp. ANG-M6]